MYRQWPSRLIQAVQRWRSAATATPSARRLIGVLAVALFAFVLYSSRESIPSANEVEWGYVAVSALVVSPIMVLWMGAQYHLSGRLTGHEIGWDEALRVAIFSGAANLLPIPGSVIIRAEALRVKGVPLKRSATASALVGIAWLGSSAVIAGALLLFESPLVGVVGLVLGAVVLAMYGVGVRGLVGPGRLMRLVVIGVLQGAGMAVTAGANLFVVARALRFDASLASIVLVSTSGVISAAVGVFPGGLGLREATAAGLSRFTDLSAAQSALAATTVHLTIIGVLLLAAIALSLGWRSDTGRGSPIESTRLTRRTDSRETP